MGRDTAKALGIPKGARPLGDYIELQQVLLPDTKILVSRMTIFAPAIGAEKGEWLAHICNVMVEQDYYRFMAVPDPTHTGLVNVLALDTRKPEPEQIVGYVEPAERQPAMQQYLAEGEYP